ncbi:hypothetical protein LNV09_20955 [Paucibacter sp. B2R-40]|uniref:hypothetical protein n=1 Tax=Paucibacter sp. B2R-40 TaxID=2893554 RepID=UPI0021E4F549|nr:hypothetical protein [Paucibacter sp. B2R-40]MCV2356617.1 hypothetical protein [Paucibacter sp. B2R-40]
MYVMSDAKTIQAFVAEPSNTEIHALITKQTKALAEFDDYAIDDLVNFIIIQPGDTFTTLCSHLGIPPNARPWEFIEEHCTCYEMVVVLRSDGFGVVIFVPKAEGINLDLLAMCKLHALPTNGQATP